MGFITIKARDAEEAKKVCEDIRAMIAKDPDLAGNIPIVMDIQEGEWRGKSPKLPQDVAVSEFALASLVARYGSRVDSYDVDRVCKWRVDGIYLIADNERWHESFQEAFEQNRDLFGDLKYKRGKQIPVHVYSVATDKAMVFHPELCFTKEHVPLMKKIFGESRVYVTHSRAGLLFTEQGCDIPDEVRWQGIEGLQKGWFDTEDKAEAECSLLAERLQNTFSLMADDLSKVRYIKGLTSKEVSVTDAALIMIWKELHAMNTRMDG